MQFIEMTGRQLLEVVHDHEIQPADLRRIGVQEDSIVRVNLQGDVELRRPTGWEIIGGLLGDFEHRIRHQTGLDWA